MPNIVIPKDYDFSKFSSVTDVAGGQGSLLSSIMNEYKNISGVLFDQETVLTDEVRQSLHKKFGNRIELTSGSFFEPILPTTDVYVLKVCACFLP